MFYERIMSACMTPGSKQHDVNVTVHRYSRLNGEVLFYWYWIHNSPHWVSLEWASFMHVWWTKLSKGRGVSPVPRLDVRQGRLEILLIPLPHLLHIPVTYLVISIYAISAYLTIAEVVVEIRCVDDSVCDDAGRQCLDNIYLGILLAITDSVWQGSKQAHHTIV